MSTLDSSRVRFVGLLTRKEGLTKDEFMERWEKHGQLIKNSVFSQSILVYEQYHIDDKLREALKEGGVLVADCDGIGIMEVESVEKFNAAMSSEEYATIISVDEETFLNRAKTVVIPAAMSTFIGNDSKLKERA
ncbi:hypothetical protein CYLTODRAFT_485846 [Cylindrobasidium torrendii FP15055 ss-10]|uniref:EthD domain-containing protein n=1 Tax=Cylindrobasidium torrendii FP15055 ss-10 TaxID=1314674 RepID=A0A0D7BU33_9AGAR|nr:hypothetical protein CYLTODRAFT_485846 [Cylindrobasidium torrendii FP15055 ss-10]